MGIDMDVTFACQRKSTIWSGTRQLDAAAKGRAMDGIRCRVLINGQNRRPWDWSRRRKCDIDDLELASLCVSRCKSQGDEQHAQHRQPLHYMEPLRTLRRSALMQAHYRDSLWDLIRRRKPARSSWDWGVAGSASTSGSAVSRNAAMSGLRPPPKHTEPESSEERCSNRSCSGASDFTNTCPFDMTSPLGGRENPAW